MYNYLKIRMVVISLQWNEPFTSIKEWVLFYRFCQVAERTNQTPALERPFHILCVLNSHCMGG